MILVFVSFENREHAQKVANYLIEHRLAACVSLIPVESYYWWKGKKMIVNEVEAIVKTKKENFAKIEKAMKELLPYRVPQLIAVDVKDANKPYLAWLNEEVS